MLDDVVKAGVKGIGKEAAEEVAEVGIKRIAKDMIGEGAEEVIAELANPLAKTIYKGKDALSEYGEGEYWQGVVDAGIIGAGTSLAYGGTVGHVTKQSDVYADTNAVMEQLQTIEKKADQMEAKGEFTPEAEAKYNENRKKNYEVLENVLKKTSEKKRADIIERYKLSGVFEADGSMKADFAQNLDTSGESAYNKKYYSRVMRGQEDLIQSDLGRINFDLAVKYGEDTQPISVFDGEFSEKGRAVESKVKQLVQLASKKSGKPIGLVITDGNVPQFNGVNVGDRIYMSASTFENGDAYKVAIEETLHFAEGTKEHDALVKLLEADGDLKAKAVEEVLSADGYGFDADAINDIEQRVEAGAIIEGGSMTAEELRYSQKHFRFLHKNFPGERESRGSDAHKWATLWAARQDIEVGDQALASYHGRWYLIQCFNEADCGYQVEAFVPMAEYRKVKAEVEEYGRSGKVKEIQGIKGGSDRIDLDNKRSYSLGREGAGVDPDEAQYGGKNRQVQRVGESTAERGERSGRDGGGDRESSGADRQGEPTTVGHGEWLAYEAYQSEIGAHMGAELLGDEKVIDRLVRTDAPQAEKIMGKLHEMIDVLKRIGDAKAMAEYKRLKKAEKLYLDAIEAAGKKYVNGKIVSIDDDEEKENTAEGGEAYLYDNLVAKNDMVVVDVPALTDAEISQYDRDHNLLARDAMKIARNVENERNTDKKTYLHCEDIERDIMVSPKSFKHGAARAEPEYYQVCLALPSILRNAIAVNELVSRGSRNGSIVLLGMAKAADKYVYVRMVVENRTWNLEDYDIVYSINQQSIKKEDVSQKAPGLRHKDGSQSSSVISIADFLHNVKSLNVINEVFSKDVAEKLGVVRSKGKLTNNLKYSLQGNETSISEEDGEGNRSADKRPTSYTKEEARAMVDSILALTAEEGSHGELKGAYSDVINRAHTLLNSAEAGKRWQK